MSHFSRHIYIGLCVFFVHAAVLWRVEVGSQRALTTTPIQLIQMLSTQLPTAPKTLQQPQANKSPTPKIEQVTRIDRRITAAPKSTSPVTADVTPQLATTEDTAKTANANPGPTLVTSPAPGTTNPATTRKDPAASSAPQSIQLPSTQADYLNNPQPIYPAISQRLGEHGIVVIRVLIGKDGSALQAEVHKSSGFERLDQAAWNSVMSWRYVPGQRAGIAQDMWFDVPVNYDLR